MRKGMGKGQGSGWKNLRCDDSRRHSLSSRGIKSAQKIPKINSVHWLLKENDASLLDINRDVLSKADKKIFDNELKKRKLNYRADEFKVATKKEMDKVWSALKRKNVDVEDVGMVEQFPMDFFEHIPDVYYGRDDRFFFFRESGTHASFIYDKVDDEVRLLRKKSYWQDNNFLKS